MNRIELFYKGNAFRELEKAFPAIIENDVDVVISDLSQINNRPAISNKSDRYSLSIKEVILPDRCYFQINDSVFEKYTDIQKKIYACVCLLNYDGYIRERYLRYLVKQPLDEWILPFLLKVSGEYIKEILTVLYESRKGKDNIVFKEFSKINPRQSERNYSRMTSYWNEYYRFEITHPRIIDGREGLKTNIRDYVGYYLFRECWGIKPHRKKGKCNENN